MLKMIDCFQMKTLFQKSQCFKTKLRLIIELKIIFKKFYLYINSKYFIYFKNDLEYLKRISKITKQ